MARRDLWIDVALAVGVLAASLALVVAGGDADPLAVVLTALASLPLAVRRLAPVAVFAVTAAASTAVAAVASPEGPPIGATIALYWVASSGAGRTRRNLALAVALLIAHAAAGGLARDAFPVAELLFGVTVWGSAWLLGDRARMRRARMEELEDRAARAEREAERERRLAAAEERSRIARDLHDSAGHAINVILVHAGLGRIRSEEEGSAARAQFETIEQVARETIGEIDHLVGALREEPRGDVEPPPGLAALDRLLERHRAAGLDVTATIHGERHALPGSVDRAAYRILQEALTNAARHGAGSARVDVGFDGGVELRVTNPLRPGTAGNGGGGHGVVGMRERASLLGGTLVAGASDGRFVVSARLP